MAQNFSLSKWYLDCITPSGETWIGYAAQLHWRAFSLSYSSMLHCTPAGHIAERTSIRNIQMPSFENDLLLWAPRMLKIEGSWRSDAKPVERVLYQTEEGVLRWSCLMPRANCILRLPDHLIRGYGYVELLHLTIPPWTLPIETLRWGRFLSETDGLVWIEWQGAEPKKILLYNGEEVHDASIGDTEITYADGRSVLHLLDPLVLRKGRLISTALKKIPGIKSIVPAKILETYECKWRSRGRLQHLPITTSEGWAIHEIVRFK
ncbi:MAG: hypothetical protein V1799_09795 [bacterium]